MLQNTLQLVGGEGEKRKKRQNFQLWKYKKTTGIGTTEDFFSVNKLINLIEKYNLQRAKEIY